jgi:hypothetical protein
MKIGFPVGIRVRQIVDHILFGPRGREISPVEKTFCLGPLFFLAKAGG